MAKSSNSDFAVISEFSQYEISRSGVVRKGDVEVSYRYAESGAAYVNLHNGERYRSRSINVLLVETFGEGAAAAAGYPEPDMKRVKMQRELANRPRSGKSLGKDARPPRHSRKCTTCGKPTNNYRCDVCWRKIRGFGMEGTAAYSDE